jgi:TonB family protein
MPGVEVSMPHFQPATRHMVVPVLALSVLLISGIAESLRGAGPQQGHLVPPQSPPMYPLGYKILSPTAGVDFLPYLTKLDSPLERNFLAMKPKSIAGMEKGVVVVRVRIQKDGSLYEGAVAIASSSGNDDVDAAAVSAIRRAAPFAQLPDKYSGAYLELEVRFYFKNEAPEQKPKLVPSERKETSSGGGSRDAYDGR